MMHRAKYGTNHALGEDMILFIVQVSNYVCTYTAYFFLSVSFICPTYVVYIIVL